MVLGKRKTIIILEDFFFHKFLLFIGLLFEFLIIFQDY